MPTIKAHSFTLLSTGRYAVEYLPTGLIKLMDKDTAVALWNGLNY